MTSSPARQEGAAPSRAKVLIVGATGHLGRYLGSALRASFDVVGTGWRRCGADDISLDVTDSRAVAAVLERTAPDIIVLTAACANVAFCEANPQVSAAVNVAGTRHVVAHAGGCPVVFYSSDAVFDGTEPEYREDDSCHPLTVYGRQKQEAESAVRTRSNALILRTARFYTREGGDGKFIDHVRSTLAQGQAVTAPVDTPGNPTYLGDLTEATRMLLVARQSGTWHLAGPPVESLYQTARIVAEVCGFDPALVRPVARDANARAPRICAVLNTDKARREGLRFRGLRDGLSLLGA
ncbi:MAG: SDR family oxidoreductase [Gemmatimonadota bacterium]|nr:SDR family oxidoreductase [Gemmatimonadota bacterium]